MEASISANNNYNNPKVMKFFVVQEATYMNGITSTLLSLTSNHCVWNSGFAWI